jgi:hypothetical protein
VLACTAFLEVTSTEIGKSSDLNRTFFCSVKKEENVSYTENVKTMKKIKNHKKETIARSFRFHKTVKSKWFTDGGF